MRRRYLILVALAACKADEGGVLRDCEAAAGNICPLVGDGSNGFNGDGLDALDSWLSFPMSMHFSPYGKPAIADWNNHKIRLMEDDGTLTTVMGTETLGDGDTDKLDMTPGGAPGTTVNLNHPTQQQYFEDGTLLSASWHTHKLRTLDPDTGTVHVWLGNAPGFDTLPEGEDPDAFHDAALCKLNQPKEILIDEAGDVFIVDMRNERIRKLLVDSWQIGTISGNGEKGYCGEGDAMETCWNFPKNANPEPGGALALDEAAGIMYVADTENHAIRAIDLASGTTTLVAGVPGEAGFADGAASAARFNWPSDIVLDGDQLFVADANNHRVRMIDLTAGTVATFAGTGDPTCPYDGDVAIPQICADQARAGDGGPAADATLYRPFGIDLDLDGNVVISDSYNHRIRVVYR